MNATEQNAAAFALVRPELLNAEPAAHEVSRDARRTLERWGHGERELVLQPINAFGDPARRAAGSGARTAASPSK